MLSVANGAATVWINLYPGGQCRYHGSEKSALTCRQPKGVTIKVTWQHVTQIPSFVWTDIVTARFGMRLRSLGKGEYDETK